jgi:hypothetical protein
MLFVLLFILSCATEKRVKKKNILSFENYLSKEQKGIKDEFYFFYQDLVPPQLIRGWYGVKNIGSGEISSDPQSRELKGLEKELDVAMGKDAEYEGDFFEEDLYDQIAYPYLDLVIIEVLVGKDGNVEGAQIIKHGTPSQNNFCMGKIKKLRFNAAYLGGIRYRTKVQVVFSRVR